MKRLLLILMLILSLFSVNAYEDLITQNEIQKFQNMLDSSEFASLEAYNNYNVPKKDGIVNLLDYVGYDTGIRQQGWCGNCWVWSGTLSTELALSIEAGIKERISVQHFDSNYEKNTGREACDGGWEFWYDKAVNLVAKVIPWTNEGADYADIRGDANFKSSDISEEIYYPLSVEYKRIDTEDLSDKVIINKLKNYIDYGKVVGFSFGLAQGSQWNYFYDFWDNNVSSDIIFMESFSSNNTYVDGGFHSINIVGYNEIERYWIVANSWGNSRDKRPQGTFRMSFDLDYNVLMDYGQRKYDFWTYDYEFGSEKGLRIEPEVDSKVNLGDIRFDKTKVEGGEVITSSVKVENDYEYMNLQNVRISYYIPKLGMKRTVGPFDVEMFEDVMKRVYLDIPKSASAGVYDVRIVLQTEDTKEVRYEQIEVK